MVTPMSRRRAAVLISGRGSNMAALVEAAQAPDYPAEIALVVSNRAAAAGLKLAQAAGWRRGGNGFLPFMFAATPDNYLWSFFGSLTFCVTSTAIPGTVFSERFRFKAIRPA